MRENINKTILKFAMLALAFALSITACRKNDVIPIDPYAGGKQALGIKFASISPKVSGQNLTFKVTGLTAYKDKAKFFINEIEAAIIEITDTEITVKLPEHVSSGGTNIVVDGQIFFGPMVSVAGKVEYDPSFNTNGTNGSVNQIFPLPSGDLILVGGFTDYASQASIKQPVNRIALVSSNGVYNKSFSSELGANGSLTSILRLGSGQYMVGGSFSSFNDRRSINNLTRLNSNGSLDITIVELVNTTPLIPENSYDTVAKFNGGTTGTISKIYQFNNQLILQGRFSNYAEYFYERSTRDRKVVGYTNINNLLRMSLDGKMDSTYNFDKNAGLALEAGNGEVNASVMQPDGKIILVGNFTKYQGKTAKYIVRIDNNGLVDDTFLGTADGGNINSIRYDATSGKYLLAGTFTSYNGNPNNGLARINADGSLDNTFNAKKFDGGKPSFAAQLSDGHIVVAGTFNKYNGIVRQGFLILNSDGSISDAYNNTGKFQGNIADIYEKRNLQGNLTVLIAGNIGMFDAKPVNNIVRFIIKP